MADCKCAENEVCKCESANEKQKMSTTHKWFAIIGLTLVTYIIILKVNKK
jgi:hypothetical protein